MRTVIRYVVVAVPPVALAVLSLLHLPAVALWIFPLLAIAPWLVIRGFDAFLTWLTAILALVYAFFFTASVAGLFGPAASSGYIGSAAFVAACAITGLAMFRRYGGRTVPGSVVVVIGSYLFLQGHLAVPVGFAGQVLIAIGWCAVLFGASRSTERPAPTAETQPTRRR
jgi:hypothetical protein